MTTPRNTKKRSLQVIVLSLMAWALLNGCIGTGSPNSNADANIEIAGLWGDSFGGWVLIAPNRWGSHTVHAYDNAENWAITQNPPDDEWSPDKYNYIVWTDVAGDGTWWTCTVAYDLDTLQAAQTTQDTSDDSDPATGGCGDFAWTQMSPRNPIEVAGLWDDNFGGQTEISVISWGNKRIHDYDNTENWAVTQNSSDDERSSDKYNYVVWTESAEDGVWWTCTVAYDLDTREAALAAPNTSDNSAPATGGCGDFAWTQMTPYEL